MNKQFPESSIVELNKHTHQGDWHKAKVKWFLMADESHFHTYLKVEIPKLKQEIRIDWHDNSTLCFEPYKNDQNGKVSEKIFIGETDWFCRECIIGCLENDMQTYKLFLFNCRTVSFVILTKICLFNSTKVEEIFNQKEMMCGIDSRECISESEIQHYLEYTKRHGNCNLF